MNLEQVSVLAVKKRTRVKRIDRSREQRLHRLKRVGNYGVSEICINFRLSTVMRFSLSKFTVKAQKPLIPA